MLKRTNLPFLPNKPGVYLFKGKSGEILYIGKAGSLANRVKSHWSRGPTGVPSPFLRESESVEWITTSNEIEAVLLEQNLIKEHLPRYNVKLKDDKRYPYIKITIKEKYPRAYLTRVVQKDGSRYFGPFPHVKEARAALEGLLNIFPLRMCKTPSKKLKRTRPCIYHEMDQCTGICSGKISLEEYLGLVDKLIEVISGKTDEIKKDVQSKMKDFASKQNFESAALYRDILAGLEEFQTQQSVLLLNKDNQDYIALGIWGEISAIFVLRRRDGKIIDGDFYYLSHPKDTDPGEQIEAFIENYYAFNRTIPPLIYISHQVISPEMITLWLSDRAGKKIKLLNKYQGENNRLMKLAMENADRKAEEGFLKIHGLSRRIDPGIVELGEILEMEELPLRMEAYDISNFSGREAVGSRVVFQDGKPAKNWYRQFRIQCDPGSGDYAMMQEMLIRRFKNSKKQMGPDPDLILIDGGKGHLHAAREIVPKKFPVISLAKREEEIFTEFSEKSIRIPFNSPASQLVRNIRDEAHRFAITAHRKRRTKKVLASELENIPGIGSARRKILLKSLGSLKKIKEASVKELVSKAKIPESVAKGIYKYYHE